MYALNPPSEIGSQQTDQVFIRQNPVVIHLYVSLACPWAHRTLIVRALKKLEAAIPVSIVEPVMSEQGWSFSPALPDNANGYSYLHQLYTATKPDYSGRVTVPVLWDTATHTIVINESADIIRMLNSAFNVFGDASIDLYPPEFHKEIDRINAFIYENINNGVYRCGFASNQIFYERAFDHLFNALGWVETRASFISRFTLCAITNLIRQ